MKWIGEVPKRANKIAGEIKGKGDSGLNWSDDRITVLEKHKAWRELLRIALQWTKAEPKNPLAWKALGKAHKNLINHGMDDEGEYTILVVNRQNRFIITRRWKPTKKPCYSTYQMILRSDVISAISTEISHSSVEWTKTKCKGSFLVILSQSLMLLPGYSLGPRPWMTVRSSIPRSPERRDRSYTAIC
jgi:hypothetical protein